MKSLADCACEVEEAGHGARLRSQTSADRGMRECSRTAGSCSGDSGALVWKYRY